MIEKTYSSNRQLASFAFPVFLLVCFISFTVPASTLTISDNLVLRDVDDKAVEQGFFTKKQSITLGQGRHTLVLKYKDVFEDLDLAEERLVKSDYFVVKFFLENQQDLVLSTIEIKDLTAAEHFAKNPELILLDEDKQEIVLALEKLGDYELEKQVTKVVTTLSATVDNGQVSIEESKANLNKDAFSKDVINQVDAMPMLKYWWKKASQEEKAKFLHYISEDKS